MLHGISQVQCINDQYKGGDMEDVAEQQAQAVCAHQDQVELEQRHAE